MREKQAETDSQRSRTIVRVMEMIYSPFVRDAVRQTRLVKSREVYMVALLGLPTLGLLNTFCIQQQQQKKHVRTEFLEN